MAVFTSMSQIFVTQPVIYFCQVQYLYFCDGVFGEGIDCHCINFRRRRGTTAEEEKRMGSQGKAKRKREGEFITLFKELIDDKTMLFQYFYNHRKLF